MPAGGVPRGHSPDTAVEAVLFYLSRKKKKNKSVTLAVNVLLF